MPDNDITIKTTIEVSGPPEAVLAWLRELPGIENGRAPQATTAVTPTPSVYYYVDENYARLYVPEISPRARAALREIALGAPETSFEAVQAALGIDGVQLGGIMASFGFAERRGFTRPFVVDKGRRAYLMKPEVAEAFLAVLPEWL